MCLAQQKRLRLLILQKRNSKIRTKAYLQSSCVVKMARFFLHSGNGRWCGGLSRLPLLGERSQARKVRFFRAFQSIKPDKLARFCATGRSDLKNRQENT